MSSGAITFLSSDIVDSGNTGDAGDGHLQDEILMIRRVCLSVTGFLAATGARADWALNMPRGATELSAETYDLHMMVFYWCVAIAVVVFGAMIFSMVRHRKSRGVTPAKFSHSMTAEVTWTIIPIIILLLMAVPAAETLIRIEDSRDPDLTVVVTASQWRWRYTYQDENVSFYSSIALPSNVARRIRSGIDPGSVENYLLDVDNPLIVPRGAKVRLLLTSSDVIHSWWVPELSIKKDAIPGFMNEAWFQVEETGVFRGQCAELCGMDHAYMPVVVEVVEPDAFRSWIDSEKEPPAREAAAE
jgi:cytochrome c oxidase subunit II